MKKLRPDLDTEDDKACIKAFQFQGQPKAYKFLKGPADMLQMYQQSFQEAMQAFAIEQQGRRRRSEYFDGVLRIPLESAQP